MIRRLCRDPLRLAAFSISLIAVAAVADAQDGGGVQRWTADDGLPSSVVMSVAQTRDGFLWVGTDAGLARYDGRSWQLFDRSTHPTLASNKISALAADRGGYLWVGTHGGGLYRYDGVNFLPVSRPNQLGGPWRVTALMQQEEGLLWVGTPQDLLFLPSSANSLRYGLPGISVTDLTLDPYGHVWASAGRGLFRQVQQTFQTLSLPLGYESQPIYSLVMTRDGELLVGREGDLTRAQGDFENTGLPQVVEPVPGVAGPVRRLLIDDGHRLVAGTDAEVLRLDAEGPTRLAALPPSEEGRQRLYALLYDREGTLWIATEAGLIQIVDADGDDQPGLTIR
ncbi:MAG: two-component regulator propeller domain-containing protein, partial [Acidobacteriota bacterium]